MCVCTHKYVCCFVSLERIRDLKQAKEDLNPDSPFCNNTGVMAMFSFSLLAVHNGLCKPRQGQQSDNVHTYSHDLGPLAFQIRHLLSTTPLPSRLCTCYLCVGTVKVAEGGGTNQGLVLRWHQKHSWFSCFRDAVGVLRLGFTLQY